MQGAGTAGAPAAASAPPAFLSKASLIINIFINLISSSSSLYRTRSRTAKRRVSPRKAMRKPRWAQPRGGASGCPRLGAQRQGEPGGVPGTPVLATPYPPFPPGPRGPGSPEARERVPARRAEEPLPGESLPGGAEPRGTPPRRVLRER